MMVSKDIQKALTAALLTRNNLVASDLSEELEYDEENRFNPDREPKSLMLRAAEKAILHKLRNKEDRNKILQVSTDFRVLLENWPVLIESPELAFHRIQEEFFSEPLRWMNIYIGHAGSLEVSWNTHETIFSSEKFEAEHGRLDWALKFMVLAIEKKLSSVDIHFYGLPDEEREDVRSHFLATAQEPINKVMREDETLRYVSDSSPQTKTLTIRWMTQTEVEFLNWSTTSTADWDRIVDFYEKSLN